VCSAVIRKLAGLSRHVSFQGHCICQQLGDCVAAVGRCDCIVDVGSGEFVLFRSLFDHETHVGIDCFESADVTGDAGALLIASEKADLILCTEHLPELRRALAEMRRMLALGGVLMLTTPLV
jgi:hypothetical protein